MINCLNDVARGLRQDRRSSVWHDASSEGDGPMESSELDVLHDTLCSRHLLCNILSHTIIERTCILLYVMSSGESNESDY